MAKQVTIATGDIDIEALAFLHGHGAKSENSLGLTIIALPETAQVERGAYHWQYTIGWYDEDGNLEEQYCEVELYVDAYETHVKLMK
jgi:hypothetical protein